MQREIDALMQISTWEYVDRPMGSNKKILRTMWVLSEKINNLNNAIFKARLVAMGNQQDETSFKLTYALTALMSSIRLFFIIASYLNFDIHHVDVCNAFINGDLQEEVYIYQPSYFEKTGADALKVCRLKKNLYGLKQAASVWFTTIDKEFRAMGLLSSPLIEGVYRKVNKVCSCTKFQPLLFVLLYVNDILIASNQQKLIDKFKQQLYERYQVKDFGLVKSFLNIDIHTHHQEDRTKYYSWSQLAYIDSMLEKFLLVDAINVTTPALKETKFQKNSEDAQTEYIENVSEEQKKFF